jgi:alkanesulfonate monooxygenase SsuD/methylene tetrahydromethanopterin reductase-like flavin-dependent oxidoreductase (luciferase family)
MTSSGDTGLRRTDLSSRNRLKIGIFGANLSSGLAATKVPERWSGSWSDNLALARVLDDAGIEFMLPVGRWKGYGGETNFEAAGFETVTWATALLASTRRITVFGTVHAPLVHPVYAAKQFVTADHVSGGRFGLNVVCGWNQDEFDMFGVSQREHDVRYAYGAEWLRAIRAIWSGGEPFDFDGEFIRLKAVEGAPAPYGGTQPVVMNAGSSDTGKAFAIAECDYLFAPIRTRLDDAAQNVADAKRRAKAVGKDDFGVFTTANVVCRPTQREAEDYYRYYADEQADWEAVDHMVGIGTRNASTTMQPEHYRQMRIRFAAGYGGWPIVGDPDTVAAGLEAVADAGFGGVALGFVNYLDEFPYFRDEVLPRLERAGVRTPLTPSKGR